MFYKKIKEIFDVHKSLKKEDDFSYFLHTLIDFGGSIHLQLNDNYDEHTILDHYDIDYDDYDGKYYLYQYNDETEKLHPFFGYELDESQHFCVSSIDNTDEKFKLFNEVLDIHLIVLKSELYYEITSSDEDTTNDELKLVV